MVYNNRGPDDKYLTITTIDIDDNPDIWRFSWSSCQQSALSCQKSVTAVGKNLLPDSSEIIKPVTEFPNRETGKIATYRGNV